MPEPLPLPAPDGGAPMPKGSSAAAILLMLLAEDEAAQVLGRLDPDEVQMLGSAMFGVADVSEEEVDGVLDQFIGRARERTTIGFGADSQIRTMMERALGAERAENMLARITPPARSSALDSLKWMDAKTIAGLVEFEHPQIAALVLAHLEPPVAADVLQLLEEELQAEVIYRVATLGAVTQEALDDLERLLLRQVNKRSNGTAPARGGASEAAKIVNSTRTATEQRVIRQLAKLDKTLARAIEDEMFIFDNLMSVSDKDLGTLMRGVESDLLVVALKGADERLRQKIFGCMSSRAAQSIQDEIAERGPMRLAEVQEAQKQILAIARQLAQAGTINLGGKGEDYV
ncbi:flagellar motor switch protein FliG [Sphingomonas morindae]|uniref:Flagellar motor switch protein FliG n=1 Tax=Sphingomonas morindae TaxID=1541170 RepID=A0ABY4X9U7_9SPHN|nr:flagellar motor switch protein FliG [Sphingomonas morindae]USI73723.1 flagellar motor switch protein FliG [Sphingomonas morindae]